MVIPSFLKSFIMSFSPKASWMLKISVISVVASLTIFYLFRPSSLQNVYQQAYRIAKEAVTEKKTAFIQGVATSEIDGPFDPSTLTALCHNREWLPGLIFRCEAPKGGIAIVRNIFLNCVRFAIEAGATSFIIPEIVSHGKSLGNIQTEVILPFEHFFDLEHFKQSLGGACPHIKFIAHINDLWDVPSTANPMSLDPSKLTKGQAEGEVIAKPGEWHEAFLRHLDTAHPTPITADQPTIVSLQAPLLQFPLSYDKPDLVANFGKILRFRDDIRRLAGAVLYAMDKTYSLGIEAEKDGVRFGHFYGAQLRTGRDAKAANWTSYATQSRNYLSHAIRSQLGVIYLASDNEENAKIFTEVAEFASVRVASKESALDGAEFVEDLKMLNALSWDQKTLIDYEVLLRAWTFGGTHESSFCWGIAMRRHVVAGKGTWIPISGEEHNMKPQKRSIGRGNARMVDEGELTLDESLEKEEKVGVKMRVDGVEAQSFTDEISTIYGPVGEGKVFVESMWP